MAKILVPVMPSERFYDAVVAAGDLVADEGGTITFLFNSVRPPQAYLENEPGGNHEADAELAADLEPEEEKEIEEWKSEMRAGMDDARDLLFERGVAEEQISYLFADLDITASEAIAAEAAAGAYDVVVLAKAEIVDMPDIPGEAPADIVAALQALAEDEGVRLLVT